MKQEILGRKFEEERALYGLHSAQIIDCIFDGPADGESALKESRDVYMENCRFALRYPLWHSGSFHLHDCTLEQSCRAPIWYSQEGTITDSDITGPKALRECQNIQLRDCTVTSEEFGWKCSGITAVDSTLNAQYLFLDSRDIRLDRVQMSGKYSFQYVEDLTIRNSVLDTKDAFWHAKNVTVENCVVKGEYLGWFSQGLTLKNCKIVGTQPLCYCKELTLIDCQMEGTDLAFEYSDVQATILGHVDSIRNPRSGLITADSVGQVIREDAVIPCDGIIALR